MSCHVSLSRHKHSIPSMVSAKFREVSHGKFPRRKVGRDHKIFITTGYVGIKNKSWFDMIWNVNIYEQSTDPWYTYNNKLWCDDVESQNLNRHVILSLHIRHNSESCMQCGHSCNYSYRVIGNHAAWGFTPRVVSILHNYYFGYTLIWNHNLNHHAITPVQIITLKLCNWVALDVLPIDVILTLSLFHGISRRSSFISAWESGPIPWHCWSVYAGVQEQL